jgi:hypothetical protein
MKKLFLIALLLLNFSAFSQYTQEGHYGDTVRATVHPNPGWKFIGWYQNDSLISTEIDLVYIIRGNADIQARLEPITYKIEIIIIPPGSATISGAGDFLPGDWTQIDIKPSVIYKIDGIKDSDGVEYSESDLKFQVNEDRVLYASLSLHWWAYAVMGVSALIIFFLTKYFRKNEK